MSNFHAYPDVKDPASTRPYTFDFGPQLGDGVTLESVDAAMISAGGCSFVGTATFTGTVSRVYISGGTAGQECIYEITAQTSDGPEAIIWAFGVPIADAATKPTVADELRADLIAVKAARTALLTTGQVKEVMRNGRKIIYDRPTLPALDAAVERLEREIAAAEAVASGQPRRRAIGLAWAN